MPNEVKWIKKLADFSFCAAAGLLAASAFHSSCAYIKKPVYLEEIIVNNSDSKKRAMKGDEQKGVAFIRNIQSNYEDIWLYNPQEQEWIDIGKNPGKKTIGNKRLDTVEMDIEYLRKFFKTDKQLVIYHPHFNWYRVNERLALPSDTDLKLMIETSREYYYFNPNGDIKFKIIQPTYGITTFYLTPEGRKGNMHLTDEEEFNLYNRWYVVNSMAAEGIGTELIDNLCREMSTNVFKVEFKSF